MEENSFQLSVPNCSHTENINTAEESRVLKLVGSERPGARTATAAQARSPLHIVVAALPPPSWTLGLRYHRDCPLKSRERLLWKRA